MIQSSVNAETFKKYFENWKESIEEQDLTSDFEPLFAYFTKNWMGTDVGIEQIAFYPRRRFKELKHCISGTGLVEAQNKSIKAILGGERKLSIENLLVALNDFGNTRAKSLTDNKSYFENENIREKSQKKK